MTLGPPAIEGLARSAGKPDTGLVTAPLASAAARHARARILGLADEGRPGEQFLAGLSRHLRAIVPFHASFWAATDPLTALPTSPARVENLSGQCEAYWEREFLVHDFNHFRDLADAPRPVASLYRASGGRPALSARYRELKRALGYGDELRAVFRTDRAAWGVVSLWREHGQPEFSAAEEKVIADLSVPIANAFRRGALLGSHRAANPPDGPGLLMFDAAGVLESLNDEAEAWLRELQPTTAVGKPHMTLIPTEILTVVARSRAVAAGVERGTARARMQSRNGRWLLVHGFTLRGQTEKSRRTALVIEPAKGSEVAPIIVEAYQLGPREQEVTQLIARGLSTADIAQRLCLSPHTVRDYVKQVFEKVGVSTRGELVAKIFADHYLEPLDGAVTHVRTDE